MDANEVLKQYAAGKRNFRQADLKEISLSKANLREADFTGANLTNSDLSDSDLGVIIDAPTAFSNGIHA
jgi:uncharacterized protein YjbI with pentapeptide repeats